MGFRVSLSIFIINGCFICYRTIIFLSIFNIILYSFSQFRRSHIYKNSNLISQLIDKSRWFYYHKYGCTGSPKIWTFLSTTKDILQKVRNVGNVFLRENEEVNAALVWLTQIIFRSKLRYRREGQFSSKSVTEDNKVNPHFLKLQVHTSPHDVDKMIGYSWWDTKRHPGKLHQLLVTTPNCIFSEG